MRAMMKSRTIWPGSRDEYFQQAIPLTNMAPGAETNVMWSGNESQTRTFVAGSGPVTDSSIVKLTFVPALALVGSAVFTIAMAVCTITALSVLWLLLVSGSGSGLDTVAVFVIVCPALPGSIVPVTVMVAWAIAPMGPSEQVRSPATIEHEPWLVDAEGERSCAGSGSVTVTAEASLGPPLVTSNVYVALSPATGGFGSNDLKIVRSADVAMTRAIASMLFPGSGSGSAADTLAEFDTVCPPTDGSTVPSIVTVACAPLAIDPSVQVTVPAEIEHEP